MFKRLFWLTVLATVAWPVWYLADLPDTGQFKSINPQTSAIRMFREKQMRDKGGKPHSLMQWRRLSQISPYLVHAVLLAEDDAFYQHNGFDVEQLKRAVKTNWERKKFAFGASTLTQQLARTLYLSNRRNVFRKAKEALVTRRLEKTLSKNRILELYMNVVEWGPQVYGAEAASQFFFNKESSDLTPEEAISLAAILPSPRRWNPLKQSGFMARRKSTLYNRMVRAHYIVPEVPSDVVTSTEPVSPPADNEELATDEAEPTAEDAPDNDQDQRETGKDKNENEETVAQ